MSRTPKYQKPEQLEKKIQEYIEQCEEEKAPLTISGLCYHCGFASRQSFYDLEKKEKFSYTVKRARLKIESMYEAKLHGNSVAGAIFALKNFGWVDSQSLQIDNGNLPFNISIESREKTNPE